MKFKSAKNAKNILLFVFLLAAMAAIILLSPSSYSKTKSYYSGDAIVYGNDIIIGSVNMGAAEIFKFANGKITREATINSPESLYASDGNFFNLIFNEDGGKLYVYLTGGRYLYKYDITSPADPALVEKEKDNSWDWFVGLAKASGGKIATLGIKGVKIWDADAGIVNSYDLKNKNYNNIQFSESGKYVSFLDGDVLKIIDGASRETKAEIDLTLKEEHNRKVFIDESGGAIYVVDDQEVGKYDFAGSFLKSFKYISHLGYGADGLAGKDHFYFSDGVGVVKINKDLKPLKWAYAAGLGGGNGWAMELKVLTAAGKERVAVFNNSSILVMDESLKTLAYVRAGEEDTNAAEALFLSADKTRAGANSLVSLRGGGYGLNEELEISFAGQNFSAKADGSGRFTKVITVPSVAAGGYDIKVTGKTSGLSYNLGFYIE